jgi:ribonuclease P protein component
VHPFKVYYSFSPLQQEPALQAAFGVSSRVFKKAVDRNRIKRLVREAYRLQKGGLQTAIEPSGKKLAVFFLYTGKELPEFTAVKEKMGVVLERLGNVPQRT